MELNSTLVNLDSLEEQLFVYNPNLKSSEERENVRRKLRLQLIESKAVVRLEGMDTECERLMTSLKQRLLFLQDILIPKHRQQIVANQKEKKMASLSLLSDSSDDEVLGTLAAKKTISEKLGKIKTIKMLHANCSELAEDENTTHLALSRKPRQRKLSIKSYESSSASNSRNCITKSYGKQEHTIFTSGVVCRNNEDILIDEIDSTPTLHIKIPSLHRDNVHYIVLDSLKFARKAFDLRARAVKQQQHQAVISETKIKKSHRKQVKAIKSDIILQQLSQQDQDAELSQLIKDVMAEACNDETLEATNSLENINNDSLNNYESHTNVSLLTFSQSSQELTSSQNSQIITQKNDSLVKKPRKYTKRSNEKKSDGPPMKRGRKPKKKNVNEIVDQTQPQPPTKSNLAKYVEYFANDCSQFIPGSSTPAASSTMSQPLVSSTTHNFEIGDQQARQQQQPITYYIDGDWANGGPCQLVPSNGMSVDLRQLNSDDFNVPFQEIVNFIDNNSDVGNNTTARVLESGNSLPISIPLPIANMGLQNFIQNQLPKKSAQHIQNLSVPIINIQIPNMPNINTSSFAPQPAHSHEEVLDLTVKSKNKMNTISNELLNIGNRANNMDLSIPNDEVNCSLPLDLSIKNAENNCVTIDDQDEAFIRQLIETSDFDYTSEGLKKDCNSTMMSYDDRNSFKAALDMPLLEFDDTDINNFVKGSTATLNKNSNNKQDKIANNCEGNLATNLDDSNYVSMTTDHNSSTENNIYFSNHSTKEIFDKLLDIGPVEEIENATNANISNNNDIGIQNLKMCIDYFKITEPQSPKKVKNKINHDEMIISSSLPENTITKSTEQRDLVKCKPSESVPSSFYSTKKNMHDNTEDLNTSLSSEVSMHLMFSDTEESNGLNNSPVHATKEDKILNSKSEDQSNENNKNTFLTDLHRSTINETEIESAKETIIKDCSESNSDLKRMKVNEKIVFSVGKISLSDTAIGRKNNGILEYKEGNNAKNKAVENQIINLSFKSKNVNCSDGVLNRDFGDIKSSLTDLILHKCDDAEKDNIDKETINVNISSEEKLRCMEVTPSKSEDFINNKQEVIDSSSEDSNCKKSLGNVKGEVNTELDTAKNLNLLDLDSKLEDPLDFEEDFDDALSLATSCFDSPNDDRFLDSIIDETILDKSEANSSSSNDKVKPFKIPKIKHSEKNSNLTDDVKINEENVLRSATTVVSKTSITAMEKVTSTVKIDSISTQSPSQINIQMNSNASEVIPCLKDVNFTNSSNVFKNIFGITCLPHLVDKCLELANCQESHQFNDPGIVFERLKTLSADIINKAYQLHYNHQKLFINYFKVFCIYYAMQNDRNKLLNMVNDCERYPEYAQFIIDIYEGLVKSGLSRANACRKILRRIRDTSTPIVDALVAIILKSDWTMFSDYIEKYTQEEYKYNFRISVLQQMAPVVLNSKDPQLKQVFGKCVQMLHCEDTNLLLNSQILIQCVALLTEM